MLDLIFVKKMVTRFIGFFIALFFSIGYAQDTADAHVQTLDSLNVILGAEHLEKAFSKWEQLERFQEGKLRIVHIGDSHIQADFLTGTLRNRFQTDYGNAGLGFTFPYKLAKTNGNQSVGYQSNVEWSRYRNVSPLSQVLIGLSGISLQQTTRDFALELEVKDPAFYFNKLSVFSSVDRPVFDVALTETKVKIERAVPKTIKHKIKRGESLSTIAARYKIGVNQLKRANGMTTNLIRVDKTLIIPTDEKILEPVYKSDFQAVALEKKEGVYQFHATMPLDRIYLLPHGEQAVYSLDGISIEKDAAGVLYHNIGVNGARFSDYNKHPLFFNQLVGLEPDLIVISMGTNEAFDKLQTGDFQQQVDDFVSHIQNLMPGVSILITTPSPSLFPKQRPNAFAQGYADSMKEKARFSNYAVWDAYAILGGNEQAVENQKKGLLSRDYVHYTKTGYEYTGNLMYEALIKAFTLYKSTHFDPEDAF